MAEEKAARDQTVTINYLKSNSFREVACDGVLGGPTPHGSIWMAFYTERFPLPRIVRHKMVPTQEENTFTLDDPGEVIEGRQGIIRNVEFGVYMTTQTAEQLYEWLGRNLELIKAGGEK